MRPEEGRGTHTQPPERTDRQPFYGRLASSFKSVLLDRASFPLCFSFDVLHSPRLIRRLSSSVLVFELVRRGASYMA